MKGIALKQSIDKLAPLIGNTPLIEILYRLNGAVRSLFVKLEQYNLTGSIKDRMAYHVLQRAVVAATCAGRTNC